MSQKPAAALTSQTTYPVAVATEVSIRRPDLASGDAIATILTADPTLTADDVIAVLDEATDEAQD
jgi:hypothetical protein